MTILALDTSAKAASVCLAQEDKIIGEFFINTALTHSQTLAPMTELLARQCGIADDAAVDLYLRLLFQAPKLWQHYHCADLTREAMALAGLPPVEGSFADAYADYTEMCLEYASRHNS